MAIAIAVVCAGCGGQAQAPGPAADHHVAAAPPAPEPRLAPVQARFEAAITDIERDAVALRTRVTNYQRLAAVPAPLPTRTRAVRAMRAQVEAMQDAYWRIAPLVLSIPALRPLDLGTQIPSSNVRPDEAGEPLTQLGAALGAGTAPLSAATVTSIAPATLLNDAQQLLDRAGRLAVEVRAASLTQATVKAAIVNALELVASDSRNWAQSPSGPLPDAARAAVTVDGLGQLLGSLPPAAAGKSLQPAVAHLAGLLRTAHTATGGASILAPELAWRATDLATLAARGDSAPGPRAAAVQSFQDALFTARWDLALGHARDAASQVAAARASLRTDLASLASGAASGALSDAAAAVRSGNADALAAARGRATAALMLGAYHLTLTAIARHDAASAQAWAAVRDFGPSAAGGVGDDALAATAQFAAGTITATQATLSVQRDELDGLQRRDIALVGQASLDRNLKLASTGAEAAALATGYWTALAPIYAQRVDATAARSAQTAFTQLAAPGAAALTTTLAASQALGQFTAAPATQAEQEQRIRQLVSAVRFTLTRSCSLAPSATPAGQLPGTVSGPPLVKRLIDDLRPSMTAAQSARLDTAEAALAALPGAIGVSGEELAQVKQLSRAVKRDCGTVSDQIQAVFGGAWQSSNDDGDFDRIAQALSSARAAAARGDWATALSSARSSYAIFDVTTELGLRAVSPGLATRIEGLYWNGGDALINQVSGHAVLTDLDPSFGQLQRAYLQARVALDSSHSAGAVAVNSGVIVLREGLEALLVIAALGSGFVTAGPRWRRPVIAGALLAFPATVLTWLVASRAVGSLASYGLRLQAVLDLISLAVLGVILAWFFQKYCWTRFVARENARRKRLIGRADGDGGMRMLLGLSVVGFMVVYREGFETVLFLQAAKAQAGSQSVILGVLLGTLATSVVGVLMLVLRRRLPYRKIVVWAAVMVSIIAVALTGQTVRSLQAVGWVGITPVPLSLPGWAGLWLGLYASVQTLAAQAAAVVAILLGRTASERLRARRLARRVRKIRAGRTSRPRPQTVAGAQSRRQVPATGPARADSAGVHDPAADHSTDAGAGERRPEPRVPLGPRS
jgi:high-affinity iron transporter